MYRNGRRGAYPRFSGRDERQQNFASRFSYGRHPYQTEYENDLRARLINELWTEQYECVICCRRLRRSDLIWSCNCCFNVLHFRCVRAWATASSSSNSVSSPDDGVVPWQCPTCRASSDQVPQRSTCFCGKMVDPPFLPTQYRGQVHGCGEVCGRRRSELCPHPCALYCHPGPCPRCAVTVTQACFCGAEQRAVRCGLSNGYQCGKVCGKTLNCGRHQCDQKCHAGSCGPCEQTFEVACFCNKVSKKARCGDPCIASNGYCCQQPCDKPLLCGVHSCSALCHRGSCQPCSLDPSLLRTCACGKTPVDELSVVRTKCSDQIPTCSKVCGKKLPCGSQGSGHFCQMTCHPGPCSKCPLKTVVPCRCGRSSKEVACEQILQEQDLTWSCDVRCKAKLSCKKHRCNKDCCTDSDHLCLLVCNQPLSCRLHRCTLLCHLGKCRPCTVTSFEELRCLCGSSVLFPPIPCGTAPPPCDRPCTRQHSCPHPVTHTCHSESSCPPCTFLMDKPCFGNHETRPNVPCFIPGISCGRRCDSVLPCGLHRCLKDCHSGPCLPDGAVCTQRCQRRRPGCGHYCNLACHGDSPCPESRCDMNVLLSCSCGQMMKKVRCFQKDEVDVTKLHTKQECERAMRNSRLAAALGLEPGESKILPNYSDSLRSGYKSEPSFAEAVEQKLCQLVRSLKLASDQELCCSFQPMNAARRKFIHEYAEHFRVSTLSYDQEPLRNVVAIAAKDRSTVPSVLLSETMRE